MSLFVHNLQVMLFFFIIALPFRQGGVMLAITWNASVWGTTFSVLARDWTARGGPGPIGVWLKVMAAVGPHMAPEACAYVLAGLAGVFPSKAVVKHSLDSRPMISILVTVSAMLGIALLPVLVGALAEAGLAPPLVKLVLGDYRL